MFTGMMIGVIISVPLQKMILPYGLSTKRARENISQFHLVAFSTCAPFPGVGDKLEGQGSCTHGLADISREISFQILQLCLPFCFLFSFFLSRLMNPASASFQSDSEISDVINHFCN